MHTYSVSEAIYNATSNDPNPLVLISATIDGIDTGRFRFEVYWDAIMQANAIGGSAAVQSILAPVLLGAISGPPFLPMPVFSAPVNPAPFIPNGRLTSVPEALVGSWSA